MTRGCTAISECLGVKDASGGERNILTLLCTNTEGSLESKTHGIVEVPFTFIDTDRQRKQAKCWRSLRVPIRSDSLKLVSSPPAHKKQPLRTARVLRWRLDAERKFLEDPETLRRTKDIERTAKQQRLAVKKSQLRSKCRREFVKPSEALKALRASEGIAQRALASGDTNLEAIKHSLEKIEIPLGDHRKNVLPKGEAEVRGMLLGLYCYGGTSGVSLATKKHPNLSKLLIGAMRAHDPDFPFTSIQLNHNYAARPHVDKNNLGCSWIVGFGAYEGGGLWVHDDEAGEATVSHTLDPEDGDVSAQYRAGCTYPGRVLCINHKWEEFDGNKLHYTLPFSGNRYTVIFFTCDQFLKASDDVRRDVKKAGFDFDWENAESLQEALRIKRLNRAKLSREMSRKSEEAAAWDRLRRGRCIARIWADGWGEQCCAVRMEGHDMCLQHVKGDRWKTHGRFDGELPPAKREEMARTQRKWLKQGKQPPTSEPWTKLVEIPSPL